MIARFSHPPTDPFSLNRRSRQAIGLVGWWPFAGSANTSMLRDFTGLHNANTSGFDFSSAWVNDAEYGVGLKFDGSDSYASAPYTPALANQNKPMTLAVWLKRVSANKVVVGRPVESYHTNPYFEYCLYMGDGTFYWRISSVNVGSSVACTANVVYHIAICVTGLRWHYYLNGKLIDDLDMPFTPADNTHQPLLFGQNASGGEVFDGTLYDVRLYSRALTAAEVWQLYDPATRWELYKPMRRVWALGETASSNPRIIRIVAC